MTPPAQPRHGSVQGLRTWLERLPGGLDTDLHTTPCPAAWMGPTVARALPHLQDADPPATLKAGWVSARLGRARSAAILTRPVQLGPAGPTASPLLDAAVIAAELNGRADCHAVRLLLTLYGQRPEVALVQAAASWQAELSVLVQTRRVEAWPDGYRDAYVVLPVLVPGPAPTARLQTLADVLALPWLALVGVTDRALE